MLFSPQAVLDVVTLFTYLKYATVQKIVKLAEKAIETGDYSLSLPGVQSPCNRDPRAAAAAPLRGPALPANNRFTVLIYLCGNVEYRH